MALHADAPRIQVPSMGLDLATEQLERLVEETHHALLRDGVVRESVMPATTPSGSAAGFAFMPSLDAVDRALEELQRGLTNIDRAIATGYHTPPQTTAA